MNNYTLADLRAINEYITFKRDALRGALEHMLLHNDLEISGYDKLLERATDDEMREYLESRKEELIKTRSEIEALKEEVNRS